MFLPWVVSRAGSIVSQTEDVNIWVLGWGIKRGHTVGEAKDDIRPLDCLVDTLRLV
jgi:hypothetical protein